MTLRFVTWHSPTNLILWNQVEHNLEIADHLSGQDVLELEWKLH